MNRGQSEPTATLHGKNQSSPSALKRGTVDYIFYRGNLKLNLKGSRRVFRIPPGPKTHTFESSTQPFVSIAMSLEVSTYHIVEDDTLDPVRLIGQEPMIQNHLYFGDVYVSDHYGILADFEVVDPPKVCV